MTITYRTFDTTTAGEPLLAPAGPFDAAHRFLQFSQQTGIDPAEIATSSMCAQPAPAYPDQWPQQRKRWAGTRPEAMWHPLMWLPTTIHERRPISIAGQEPSIEDDNLWVVRIMVDLQHASTTDPETATTIPLWDEATGSWLDILAYHGLNIEDTENRDRVQAWLDGGDDNILDNIDLTRWFQTDDQMPHWSTVYAWNAMAILRPASYAVHAHALAGHLEDLTTADPGSQTTTFKLVATIAADTFADIDGEPQWWLDNAEQPNVNGELIHEAITRLDRLATYLEEQTQPAQPNWDALAADVWNAPPAP